MVDFIIEYWWQIAVYLVGCVLAYGRWGAIVSFYYLKKRNPIKWLICILLSWLFFAVGLYFYYNPKQRYEKFFKWAPVLLLCVLFAVSCKNEPYKYQCLSADGTSHGSYFQYPKGTRINWGSGDPAWKIDSCYEFAIKENALK